MGTPRPRVMELTERAQPEPMHKVMINKVISNARTPRVEKTKPTQRATRTENKSEDSLQQSQWHVSTNKTLTFDRPHEPASKHN
jgi:hypothetical protein